MEASSDPLPPMPRAELDPHLTCAVCLTMYCEPISLVCGHTACRMCLLNSLKRNRKKCPVCRAVCQISAESAHENVVIREICKAFDPALYAARAEETAAEKSEWALTLPIFYYNDCLFPGGTLALHLFEPRYKLLAQRANDTTRTFAYVPNFSNYQANVGDLALVARLDECDMLPDGRCTIEATLTTRNLITEHFIEDGTGGLHYCKLQPISDEPLDEAARIAVTARVEAIRAKVSALDPHVMQGYVNKNGPMPAASQPEAFSLWLLGMCDTSSTHKLQLLRSRNTAQRLEAAAPHVDTLLARFGTQGGRGGRGQGGRGRGGRGGGGRGAMGDLGPMLAAMAGMAPPQDGGRGRGRGGGRGGGGRGGGGGGGGQFNLEQMLGQMLQQAAAGNMGNMEGFGEMMGGFPFEIGGLGQEQEDDEDEDGAEMPDLAEDSDDDGPGAGNGGGGRAPRAAAAAAPAAPAVDAPMPDLVGDESEDERDRARARNAAVGVADDDDEEEEEEWEDDDEDGEDWEDDDEDEEEDDDDDDLPGLMGEDDDDEVEGGENGP